MMRHGTCALVSLLLLCSCALFPLGEADCKGVNWRQRGYNDGFGGAPQQDLRLAEECRARFAVEVPQDEYLAGYRDGYFEYERLHPSNGGMRPK